MTNISLLSNGLDAEVQRSLREACRTLGYSVLDAQERVEQVLVAALGSGERQIPVEAAELLGAASAATPLMLLASEPLVRGHVVLAQGRIHLVAPPHDTERLRVRLEHVVRGRPPATADAVPFRSDLFRMSERWATDYWACVLSAAPEHPGDEAGRLHLIEKRVDGCFAFFPTESTRHRPDDVVALFERLLLGDDRSLWQWLADFSGLGAVVAYDSEARELIVDLPAGDECAAFLLSAQRLPNVSPLPTGKPHCVAAGPGDLLLAAIGVDAVRLLDAETVRGMVRAGGAFGASELKSRFPQMSSSNAILLVEARE